jgi:hypothetical protein
MVPMQRHVDFNIPNHVFVCGSTCEFLDLQSLDLVLQCADLAHQVRGLVSGNGAGDDSARHAAGPSECHL